MIALSEGRSFAISPILTGVRIPSLAVTALVVLAGLLLDGHASPAALLAVAVVAGLPHGASDGETGRAAFAGMGRGWWALFLLGYVGLVCATLAAWAVAATIMLAVFLLLSIVHFGMQDAPGGSRLAIVAHGGVPIVVPALFHPQAVQHLFAILIGNGGAAGLEAALRGPVASLWLAAVIVEVWRAIDIADFASARQRWPALADLLLVGLLFAAASPLVAFSLYFALLHTPRALLEQRRRTAELPSPWQTAALTILACLLGLGIFVSGHGIPATADIVRTSFLLLSALTVPHMALEYLAARHARIARPVDINCSR